MLLCSYPDVLGSQMLTSWRGTYEYVSRSTILWQEEALCSKGTSSTHLHPSSPAPKGMLHSLLLLLSLCLPGAKGHEKVPNQALLCNWPTPKLQNLPCTPSEVGTFHSLCHLSPITLTCSKSPVSRTTNAQGSQVERESLCLPGN